MIQGLVFGLERSLVRTNLNLSQIISGFALDDFRIELETVNWIRSQFYSNAIPGNLET